MSIEDDEDDTRIWDTREARRALRTLCEEVRKAAEEGLQPPCLAITPDAGHRHRALELGGAGRGDAPADQAAHGRVVDGTCRLPGVWSAQADGAVFQRVGREPPNV